MSDDSSGAGGGGPPPVSIKPMFINPTKKYGLIINKPAEKKALPSSLSESLRAKKPALGGAKPCIFDEDEEDEEAEEVQVGNKKTANPLLYGKLNAGVTSSHMKKQTQIEIEKALAVDASVFEYDAIYDDQVAKQKSQLDPAAKARQAETASKEPKYMAGLMKAAAKRKMDFEKLQEKKIQKEREAEGDLWGDKEVFVTSAYRQKLEERQQLEEEERRQEQLESLLDVRRQKDLSGFYDSMLKIRSGEMIIEEESEKEKRLEREKAAAAAKAKATATGGRQFRAKHGESEDEEEEQEAAEVKVESGDLPAPGDLPEPGDQPEPEQAAKSDDADQPEFKKPKIEPKAQEVKVEEKLPVLSKEERRELRRQQLFTKRTVNEKFDAELAEYFVRKSTILALKSYIERET